MKRRYSFVYVVLHFKNYNVTNECIESILKLDGSEESYILIVDNGSNDKSGQYLKNKYAGFNNIKVLIRTGDFGFSNGNNFGFAFIKNNINYKYIIFTNNDMIFDQREFNTLIENSYAKYHFDVLGPDIILKETGQSSSPLSYKTMEISQVKRMLIYAKVRSMFPLLTIVKRKIVYVLKKHKLENIDYEHLCYNCVLSGACLVMSRKFLNKKGSPFYPETPFYYEEEIMFTQMIKSKQLSIYNPELKVIHNHESAATKKLIKNKIMRQRFQAKNDFSSLKIYLNLLERLNIK